MTTDEINKYIHVEIMGLTLKHRLTIRGTYCIECGTRHPNLSKDCSDPSIADYCSDASPRSLLNEPIRLTTIAVGWDAIELALNAQAEKHIVRPYAEVSLATLMNLSALEISTALIEAHKSQCTTN